MSGLRLNGVAKSCPQAPVYARYHLQLGKMLDEKKFKGTSPGNYLRNVDVQWGKINVADLPQMDFSDEEREKYSLKRGDILICEGGECGRAAIWESDEEECCFQKALHRLRPLSNEADDPRFFLWVMRAAVFDEVFTTFGTGSATIDHLPAERLRLFRYPCPPLADQRRIAAYLDAETRQMDALVAEKEAMLKLLEEKRAAQISHAVTRGQNPRAPLKPSALPWLGDIPKHWEVRRLKHFSVIGNGSTPSVENADYWTEDEEAGFPWLNSSVVNAEIVTSGSRLVTSLALKECHLPVISPPAVLVGITGQGKTRGMASILGIKATINQHLAYVKPTSEAECPFLCLALNNAYNFLRSESDGAGSTKGAITCEQLGNVALPVPPLEEQRAIVAHLAAERERTAGLETTLKQSIHLLQERRRALITAAVTGQIAI